MTNKRNISLIVASELCIGCGFCVACCPKQAIQMNQSTSGFFVPSIYSKQCTECGICISICPGPGVDLQKNMSSNTCYNNLLGNYKDAVVGYATDSAIRYSASSGGLITALLVFLMRKKIIDGAVVATMNNKNPLQAMAMIATNEEEVIQATGSKYTPVSMHKVLCQILQNKDNRIFAFVGLPCHLEALCKAKKLFVNLDNLIILKIGLYCNNTPSINATKYVLKQNNVDPQKVSSITYRGKGWPGVMNIQLNDGKQLNLPMLKYFASGFGQYFCRKRCVLCADQTAELADISLADPWSLVESDSINHDDQFGISLVLVRTSVGQNMLNKAFNAGFISLRKINPKKNIQFATFLKKSNKSSGSVKFLLGVKSLPIQSYSLPLSLTVTRWLFRYRINSFLARNKNTWPLLRFSVTATSHLNSLMSSVKHLKKQKKQTT